MRKAFVIIALLVTGLAGTAQASDNAPSTTRIGPSTDPSQVICRRENVIGSRVTTMRVCRTRAEWAEHRRQYQQNIERAQRERPTNMQ